MSSSSSSQHKHDQKLKSVGVVAEEKETMNNNLPENKKLYICLSCKGVFRTPHALGGHSTTQKKDRELERQQKINIEPMLSDEGSLMKLSNKDKYSSLLVGESSQDVIPSLSFLTENTSYNTSSEGSLPSNHYNSHALSNDINLELTLGPSKSIGGSNDNNTINSSFNGEVTRGTTDMVTLVRPHVSKFHFVSGNPLDSITKNIPTSVAPPHRNLCRDLFSLQENGSGSCGFKSLISKRKNKAMVPEDDNKDIGIRWLTKRKRSR